MSNELYKLLDQKRRAWFSKVSKERHQMVDKAKHEHLCSVQFQQKLCNPTPDVQGELLSFLFRMSQSMVANEGYHIVFCLDESGSMSGNKGAS